MPVVWRTDKNKSVSARAGTGKTSTITEGVNRICGKWNWKYPFTDQQLKILDEMVNYGGQDELLVMSMGKAIVAELETRLKKTGVRVTSFHRYGASLLYKRCWGKTKSDWKVTNTYVKELGYKVDHYRTAYPEMSLAVKHLVDLSRYFLLMKLDEKWFNQLADTYEVDFGRAPTELIIDTVNTVLKACRENTEVIDYTDSIYMPMIYDLVPRKYGMVIVDEWQDTNLAQQELARASGDTLCLFGDPFQSIYGFAGADWKAYDRLKTTMQRSEYGLIEMPLTTSFRCSHAVIREAQKKVPDITCLPSANEGSVQYVDSAGMKMDDLLNGFVLCRTNAPLVKLAMELGALNNKVCVVGQDIGAQLYRLVESFNVSSCKELRRELQRWYDQSTVRSKKFKIDTLNCLLVVADKCHNLSDVKNTINNMFTDTDSKAPTKLMSIHKSKGLESEKVVFWGEDLLPHYMSTTEMALAQEENLWYVAVTRAKDNLFVTKGTNWK